MSTVTTAPPREIWSTGVRVALAPSRTYAALVAASAPMTWSGAFVRPAATLLVISIAVPLLAVRRVTAPLVVLTAIAWSFVPLLQLLAGAALIASARRGHIAMPRAIDLWFAASLPYNLWMLAAAAFVAATGWSGSIVWLLASALPALVWTAVLGVHAFPGDGALTPWSLRDQAARLGIDVIAITNHNQTFTGRLADAIATPEPPGARLGPRGARSSRRIGDRAPRRSAR